MNYRSDFTVVISRKTGRILHEIWEVKKRLFWPLPWKRLPKKPIFRSWEDLDTWFRENYPGETLKYYHYGRSHISDP